MTLDYTEGKIKMLDSVVKKIDIPWKIWWRGQHRWSGAW
jgi:hypothetical protein